MDPADSLDWIWEDFNSSGQEFEDEDSDGDYRDRDDNGDDDDYNESDDVSSADSSVGCSSLWVGDPITAREDLNVIVNDVRRRYGRGADVNDDGAESETTTTVGGENVAVDKNNDDDRVSVDGFYADAIDAAKDLLSEVQLVWTDTLYRCTVNV